jgi:eukaryotic-like serine/threonine-protein kinase
MIRDRRSAEELSRDGRGQHQEPSPGGDRFLPGATIGGCCIEEWRGEGGFASLYRAKRIDSGQEVALKVLHRHLLTDDQALERLRREAAIVNELRHPHIVQVFECGEVGAGRPFIVMEWLQGRNLQEELAARGPLSPSETLTVMEQLCSALGAAHDRGIVHRDLKAQNVMAVPRDDWFFVKLVDFGMAKLIDRVYPKTDLTTSSTLAGTPLTMAPEQILGDPTDERTDIYALGLLLHQLLTGVLPFRGATAVETEDLHLNAPPPRISEVAPVPAAVDAVLARSLDKSPGRRFPHVDFFLSDLRTALASCEPVATSPVPAVGVFIQARMPEDTSAADELTQLRLFDDLDRVLAAARAALSSLDLTPAIESADAVLGTAPLPEAPKAAAHFRWCVLEAMIALVDRLAVRPGPLVTVHITAHVAGAFTRLHRGRPVLEGDLMQVREWAGGQVAGSVVATGPMLAGLDEAFRTTPVRPGHTVVRTLRPAG